MIYATEFTTRARTNDIRERQKRRKALKPLLRELLVRNPYNLPAELLPHILTWVGYDPDPQLSDLLYVFCNVPDWGILLPE